MKHVFTLVNAVLISMALGGSHSHAANLTPWNGSVKMPDLNGQIYTITSAEELAWIAQQSQSSDFSGYTIRLNTDLDMGGTLPIPSGWLPIGNAAHPFQGEIDGDNHILYNLYILDSFTDGAGMIAQTGAQAVIHHLGLAQGQIMTDGTHDVGGFIGINRGTLDHCFSMLQIIAHNGDNIGGLVGTNEGTIRYSYNTGIITDANNHAGGLVGINKASAVLDACYNSGYCKSSDHAGALFGANEAPPAQLTSVYFDQQMTRMHATGYGANDPLLDNTKYAITKTSTFMSKHSPFHEQPEWTHETGGYWRYPRLTCFGDHEAALVSTLAIGLDAENLPMERAEGVGTPMEGNKPRKQIALMSLNGTYTAQWTSPTPDIIRIASPTATLAEVRRPCGNYEVILSVSYGTAVKQIYTIVKGYDAFDAGRLEGTVFACWNEAGVKFPQSNKDGKEAIGGKDDEQDNAEVSYQYMLIRDTVILNEDSSFSYLPIDTFYFTQKGYTDWQMPTDMPGRYAFRRYVHDYQCRTEWLESAGRLYLTISEVFDPGALRDISDTICGLPQTWTIYDSIAPSGGAELFAYRWWFIKETVNPQTGVRDTVIRQGTPYDSLGYEIKTDSCPMYFTEPGEYIFTREVSEAQCQQLPLPSLFTHRVVVLANSCDSTEHNPDPDDPEPIDPEDPGDPDEPEQKCLEGFVHRKWDDVAFVDNNDSNCEPDCEQELQFTEWQWYKDDEPIPGATGQYYYEPGGLNGFYFVRMTATDGSVYLSCVYEMRPAQGMERTQETTTVQTLLRNGQLLLVVGGKVYTVLGQEVRL